MAANNEKACHVCGIFHGLLNPDFCHYCLGDADILLHNGRYGREYIVVRKYNGKPVCKKCYDRYLARRHARGLVRQNIPNQIRAAQALSSMRQQKFFPITAKHEVMQTCQDKSESGLET